MAGFKLGRREILLGGAGLAAAGAAFFVASGLLRQPRAGDGDLAGLGKGVDDVRLTAETGEPQIWGELKGKPRALFFGFTHCPVICPVTVWELNDAIGRIGGPAQEIAIQFVTVDPERDTPEVLQSYFSGFDGRVKAFTGEADAIARLARAFDVVYQRAPLEGGGYSMDHTATVFLLNADGEVVDVVAYGAPRELMETRLRALVGLPVAA